MALRLDERAPGLRGGVRPPDPSSAREQPTDVREQVAAILARVAAEGDPALLDYTQRFDRHRLERRRTADRRRRDRAGDRGLPGRAAPGARAGGRPDRRLPSPPAAGRPGLRRFPRRAARASLAAGRGGRDLRAGRHRGLSELGPDERDPGADRGRRAGGHGGAGAGAACSTLWSWSPRRSPASTRSSGSAAPRRSRRSRSAPQTIRPVDKIVGPGNAYVAEAKRQVFGRVGIDMIAGPSEILVVADGDQDPAWIAADLLSQAEHDELAQAILITDERGARRSGCGRGRAYSSRICRGARSRPPAGGISAPSSGCRISPMRPRWSTGWRPSISSCSGRGPRRWPRASGTPARSSLGPTRPR